MERKIIRKLSNTEILYDNEIRAKNLILGMIFMIDSKFTVTSELAREAAARLTRRHPLLRAAVRPYELERYFIEMDETRAFDFSQTVEIIDETESCGWLDVLGREQDTDFDCSNGHLWRMRLVKLSQTRKNKYALIYMLHHSIGDGRNSCELPVQYLDILAELSIRDNGCDETHFIDHSLYTHDELVAQSCLHFEHEISTQDERNRDVAAFKSDKPLEDRNHKFEFFHLPKSKLDQLIIKAKSNTKKAKLGSVLTLIVCVALRKLYAAHEISNDEIPLDHYNINVLTCLRDRLKIDRSTMGVYSSMLHMNQTLPTSILEEIGKGDFASFWSKCDDYADKIHTRLHENQDFSYLTEMDKSIEYFKPTGLKDRSTPLKTNSLNFVMSSIGVLHNTVRTDLIKVEEAYFRMRRFDRMARRVGYTLFVGAATVDGKLCVSLSFTEDYMSVEIVRELIGEIQRLIDQIVKI